MERRVASTPFAGLDLRYRRAADPAVRREQVRLVFGAPVITLVNLINAPVVAALLWRIYAPPLVIGWLAAFVAVIFARGLLWRFYQRAEPSEGSVGAWGLAFSVGAALTGLLWGMLGSIVFTSADPLHILFVAFLLGGMTAGSSVRDSAYPLAFYAFAVPAMTPMVTALLTVGGPVYYTMALMLAAYSAVLFMAARRNSRWIAESIRLRLQQVTLNENLSRATEQMADNLEILRRHQRDMTSIAKLSDLLQACQTRTEAYPIIAGAAARLFPDVSGGLSVMSSEAQEMETVARWGRASTLADAFGVDDCWALRSGQIYEVASADAAAQCRHFATRPRGAYACLPLNVQGETTGLLHLSLSPGRELDDDLHRLMLTFGDVVKLSLSNLKLRESLSEQALRDPLTGMFNRRYLTETLPREIRRARRDHTALTVALLDVDHFKAFNDTYGHAAGDLVLREVGGYLKRSLRAGDVACRYGGEEFLLVLAECDAAEAQVRLARICQDIKAKIFTFRRQRLPSITLSAGLAELGDGIGSGEALISAADQALYQAKQAGRDRIVLQPSGADSEPAALA